MHDLSADRPLFSAKEAVFAASSPVVGDWLDAEHVEVTLGDEAEFTARLAHADLVVAEREVTSLFGRWARAQGLLATTVVLANPGGGT